MSEQVVLLREDYKGYVLVARWNPDFQEWEAQAGFLDTTVPVPREGDWKWGTVTGTHVKIELDIPLQVELSGPAIPVDIVHVINGQPGFRAWMRPVWREWTSHSVFEHLKRWIDAA